MRYFLSGDDCSPLRIVFLFVERKMYGRDVDKTIAPAPWCVSYSPILESITELKNCEENSHLCDSLF